MKKFTFTETPALSKNLTKEDSPLRNKTNYPSVLLLLPPIFFSSDALFFICFNLDQDELLLAKIIEIFLHLFLIFSFFILKKYQLPPMARNIVFLFVRTCHLIILMESEKWKGNFGELRIVVNGIKLSYLEFIFFFLFNSPKFFMTSLVSNFVYTGIRVPTNALFDYFHLLLLLLAVFTAIVILGREKRMNFFFFQQKKIPKLEKALSFKKVLRIFSENTIDHFMEEIEEGVVLLDDDFVVIKQNQKFTNLLNKIGKDNSIEVLFGAEITAVKEGAENLKSWSNEKNFTISKSKNETFNRNKDCRENSIFTLYNLLSLIFPAQAEKLNLSVKLHSLSPQPTKNSKNPNSQNLQQRIQANDLKVSN